MSTTLQRRTRGETLDIQEQLRSLVEEGRILEARDLLAAAGDQVPEGTKIREILGPPRVRKSDVLDFDRSAEFRWLKRHAAEHQGQWVALLGETLVASAQTLKELLARLDQLQLQQKPLIHHLV